MDKQFIKTGESTPVKIGKGALKILKKIFIGDLPPEKRRIVRKRAIESDELRKELVYSEPTEKKMSRDKIGLFEYLKIRKRLWEDFGFDLDKYLEEKEKKKKKKKDEEIK